MKDIVILFGAGASFGAGGTVPEQPPLGSQLYSILERVYPGTWGSFPSHIKGAFREDFERGMQLVYESLGGDVPALMREMAVYLVQFRPYRRSTLYCRLISDMQKGGFAHRVLFSTLNYDCVLEYSLLEQGFSISCFDEGDPETVPVWKLHGSCNMFCQGVQAGQGMRYGTGVVFQGGVQAFLDPNRVIQHCLAETGLAPVMCLYMPGKPLQVSPSVIQQLQQAWARRVEAAAALFCVGVRPLLGDTHVWKPLASAQAPLYFVGDREALDAWRTAERPGSTEYLGRTFVTGYGPLLRRLGAHEPD